MNGGFMDLKNTTWDNTNLYKNFQDPAIDRDLQIAEKALANILSKISVFSSALNTLETSTLEALRPTLETAREISRSKMDILILIGSMKSFAQRRLSTHSQSKEAKDLDSKSSKILTQLNQTTNPLDLFLLRAPEAYVKEYLNDSRVKETAFSLNHQRERNDFLLSAEAEALLIGHGVDGLHGWGKLYTEMASTIQADVAGLGRMGLAKASTLIFQGDRMVRENAYRAINAAWTQFQVPTASVLNAIYGWRIENYKARSTKRELNYLDVTCHSERIQPQTLATLMDVTYKNRTLGHRALKMIAHEMQIPKAGPWDALAAYPEKLSANQKITLPDAMKIISSAFAEFDLGMAEFADMAYKKNWLDTEPTEHRQTGAYCSGFSVLRESRIFMTYDGSVKNVITLAHELGHAYHSWVMRDIPLFETWCSSSIAETASIFAETLVRAALLRKAVTVEEKKKILWQEIESATSFLNDIPSRFELEKSIFENRKQRNLSADDFKTLTEKAMEKWYGDSISEYNEMFWASKMHFHISGMSFYNYPYLFGYLFSLGIYSQKDQHGTGFAKLYTDLLRDSGRMTAEGLIMKYFNQDITQPEFWLNSVKQIEKSISAYEQMLANELRFVEEESTALTKSPALEPTT